MRTTAPLLALLMLLVAGAETRGAAAGPPRKWAFVVGVSEYDKADFERLPYAESDAKALAAEFRAAGFDAQLMLGSHAGERRAVAANLRKKLLAEFIGSLRALDKSDVALVVLCGHGLQMQIPQERDGQTVLVEDAFFCPADAIANDPATMLSISELMDAMVRSSQSLNNLIVVDACRNNPSRGVDASSIAIPDERLGVLFAASPGQRAFESVEKKRGLLAHFLLEGLRGAARSADGDVTWQSLVDFAMTRVPDAAEAIHEVQDPHAVTSLRGKPPVLVARAALAKLAAGGGGSSEKFASRATGMEFVLVPAGQFTMGSPLQEVDRDSVEAQHDVRITRPFYAGTSEVTQRQFATVMGFNPSDFSPRGDQGHAVAGQATDDFPVEKATWYDALEFCNRLSAADGLPAYYRLEVLSRDGQHIQTAAAAIVGGDGYRLLTEAEWEYACRAGTATAFHFGDASNGSNANVDGTDPYGQLGPGPQLGRTVAVRSYGPNAWGLFDMHGNVFEWCQDDYVEDHAALGAEDPASFAGGEVRVLRGGAWDNFPWASRAAARDATEPGDRYRTIGFRVARTP